MCARCQRRAAARSSAWGTPRWTTTQRSGGWPPCGRRAALLHARDAPCVRAARHLESKCVESTPACCTPCPQRQAVPDHKAAQSALPARSLHSRHTRELHGHRAGEHWDADRASIPGGCRQVTTVRSRMLPPAKNITVANRSHVPHKNPPRTSAPVLPPNSPSIACMPLPVCHVGAPWLVLTGPGGAAACRGGAPRAA